MELLESTAVKLGAYTLFCHQLLRYLPALKDATRADLRLTNDRCLGRFNESLRIFFEEAAPLDLPQAVAELGSVLEGRVALFRAQNPLAAAVFDQVVEEALAAAISWRYEGDLDFFHRQGRQLARHFFANSPWPSTQARLDREAQLVFCEVEDPAVPRRKVIGYHPTPVAYREKCWDDERGQELDHVILVRFGFGHDFGLYLAYPYLFMHEYAAHIFSFDPGSVLFNDGWLLQGTDVFLARRGWELDLQPPLAREQIAAFGDYLYGGLDHRSRQACCFARDFALWLRDSDYLQAMTWELAAFEPGAGESEFWPDQVINRLWQAFDTDHTLLGRKIKAALDLRALYEMLSPE